MSTVTPPVPDPVPDPSPNVGGPIPGDVPSQNTVVRFIRNVLNAESESPTVRTAGRGLLSAVVAAAVGVLTAYVKSRYGV